ncbi:MAG: prmC [Firmicutes bacterium]|nr:prmC [Bacillota bacterium]
MAEQWTIEKLIAWTKQYFSARGIDTPRLDAEVLLSRILGKDRTYLYVHYDQPLEAEELAKYRQAVKRRAERQPVAYITGHKEFMGLDFVVNPAVLIPRPDTEILAEAALERLTAPTAPAAPALLDVGTGSGALIVSLLAKLPAATGTAVDISEMALEVAAANARRQKVDDRLTLLKSDLFSALGDRRFDAIVSNPPYIPTLEIAGLEPEVRYEPVMALDGGQDGLNCYRRLLAGCPKHLEAGGFMAVEVGEGQAQAVAALAANLDGLAVSEIRKDYAGIERVVIVTFN